jgi:hypothetical protein
MQGPASLAYQPTARERVVAVMGGFRKVGEEPDRGWTPRMLLHELERRER